VLVTLDSGREILLVGDSTWHMDGVRQVVGKDAPWITEDQPAVMDQLRWLNALMRDEPKSVVIASHDDEQHRDLLRRGAINVGLQQ
jgi:hypothetical protein